MSSPKASSDFGNSPLLQLQGLQVHYGSVQALHGVELKIGRASCRERV